MRFFFIDEGYGRGAGLGRGRGAGLDLGVGVDLAVAVAVAVGVGVAVAVGVGLAGGVAVGVGGGGAQGCNWYVTFKPLVRIGVLHEKVVASHGPPMPLSCTPLSSDPPLSAVIP